MQTSDLAKNLDTVLAVSLIVFSLFIIVAFGLYIVRPIYLVAGIFLFLSGGIWLVLGKKASIETKVAVHGFAEYLPVVYFILLFAGIITVYARSDLYQRPLVFFVIISLLAAVIFLEIFYMDMQWRYGILIQIILLGLTFTWTQMVLFQGFIGIDTWWHYYVTEKIALNSHMPLGYGYSFLPMFHLFMYSSQLITGLDYRSIIIFSLPLLQIGVLVLAVYLIADHLMNNPRVALLAALFPVIANYVVSLSFQPVPNSLAALFVPVVIYLLLKMKEQNRIALMSTIIVLLLMIVFTHTITALFMAITLFLFEVGYLVYNYLQGRRYPSYYAGIFAFFVVIMLVWWEYISNSMIELVTLFDSGFSASRFIRAPSVLLEYARNLPLSEQLFTMLGIFLFFSIALIGLFYLIRRQKPQYFIVAVAFVSPLVIGFTSLLGGYSVIEVRWWFFAQILLSIAVAIGFVIFINTRRTSRYIVPAMGGFIFVLTLLMLLHPLANVDFSTYPPDSRIRYAYTDSELASVKHFSQIPFDTIASDFNFCSNQSVNPCVDYYNISYYQIGNLEPVWYRGNFTRDGTITIIRDEVVSHPFRISGTLYKLTYDPNDVLTEMKFNKIYANPSVQAYL